MKADGYSVGDQVEGKVLLGRYSRYMQRVAQEAPELVEELAEPAHPGAIGADLGVEVAAGIRGIAGIAGDAPQQLHIERAAPNQVHRRDDLARFMDRAGDRRAVRRDLPG